MAFRKEAVTLTEYAYDMIRTRILRGEVRPGEPLLLAKLSKGLEVSMSVVREALVRLSEQGLVVASPNQGFRVVTLSVEDLLDLTDLRLELERRAFERSIGNGDVQWEGEVVSAHHVLERITTEAAMSPEWITAHAAFHDALYMACGSPRLLALVRSTRAGAEVYRQWSGRFATTEGRDVAGEHRELMELALARDAGAAGRALAKHLRTTTDILIAHEKQVAGAD